jgi:CubicO group peptidase (beta-lactamase class C family)
MGPVTTTHGLVEPGFGPVADAFRRNFAEHGEVGAACSVVVDGRTVVDVWGGVADPATGRPYEQDAIQVVFSCTKGAVAACANILADRGVLDVDSPAARVWPEFAQAGKGDVPVRWLLTHQVGLLSVDTPLTPAQVYAWDPIVEALAAQAPEWEPGTSCTYHALSWGWLVGEVLRRLDGRPLGRLVREELSEPLGLDLWVGLPEAEEHRVVPLLGEPARPAAIAALPAAVARAASLGGTFAAPVQDRGNERAWRAAEIGSAGGVSDARSLARLYAGLIGPVDGAPSAPVLSREQLDRARTVQAVAHIAVAAIPGLEIELPFGLGFMLPGPFAATGGPGSFGHSGAGGALGCGDPEHGLAFGYAMNRLDFGLDPRARGLLAAAYQSLGVPLS